MVNSDVLTAQHSVIGALCIDPTIAGEFFQTVRQEDFTDPTCGTVYSAAKEIFGEQRHLDATVIAARLGNEYNQWLMEIMEITPTSAGWKDYAALAKEQARDQRVHELAVQLQAAKGIGAQQEITQRIADQFVEDGQKDESFRGAAMRWMAKMDSPREYIEFGMEPLDAGKLFVTPGKFLVFGARPSVGKTAIALQWATYMALHHKVGFFSLETSTEDIMDRIYTRETHIPNTKIQKGDLRDVEWQVIAQKTNQFAKHLRLDIIEAAGYTVDQIAAKSAARRYKIIFIDYLQLIQSDDPKTYDRVTKISMKLHTFAQRTKTLVIALCQLRRTEGEPKMSDLRESGQIEQDADIIMLMHLQDDDDRNSNRILTIAKNKTGPLGRCTYRFNAIYQEFHYIPAKKRVEHQKTSKSAAPKTEQPAPDQPPEVANVEQLQLTPVAGKRWGITT